MWAMSTNAIVLIIGAIVAAVALLSYGIYKLYINWAAIFEKITNITKNFANFFKGLELGPKMQLDRSTYYERFSIMGRAGRY